MRFGTRYNPQTTTLAAHPCYRCGQALGLTNLGIRHGMIMHRQCADDYDAEEKPHLLIPTNDPHVTLRRPL